MLKRIQYFVESIVCFHPFRTLRLRMRIQDERLEIIRFLSVSTLRRRYTLEFLVWNRSGDWEKDSTDLRLEVERLPDYEPLHKYQISSLSFRKRMSQLRTFALESAVVLAMLILGFVLTFAMMAGCV